MVVTYNNPFNQEGPNGSEQFDLDIATCLHRPRTEHLLLCVLTVTVFIFS